MLEKKSFIITILFISDNLRQSMQRYLATKHQHLKKASEQLLANRPSEFRQSLNLVQFHENSAGNNLPPYQHPPKPITTTVTPCIEKSSSSNNLIVTTSHTSISNTISSTNNSAAVELTKLTLKNNSSQDHANNILEDQVTKDTNACNNNGAVADNIPSVSQQGKYFFSFYF